LRTLIEASLEDDKAEDIVVIDLRGKTTIADYMIVATGRSQRHVTTLADHLVERIKKLGIQRSVPVEGKARSDWVLVDAGDVIAHLFRPEVREFYNLEKMWGAAQPSNDPAPDPATDPVREATA
jgi:ribosome-associated protein